ncbi:hypothetical protein Lal_00042420 [Lupinus albus]|nr:hypothetical protein Lal_00042420 [Lupinus albus]
MVPKTPNHKQFSPIPIREKIKVSKEIQDLVEEDYHTKTLSKGIQKELKRFRTLSLKGQSSRKFLEEIEQYFSKNEKVETSNLLSKLILMKHKGKGNIMGYIMEMFNLTSKLKLLKLEHGFSPERGVSRLSETELKGLCDSRLSESKLA